jgi:6-pyruvoyltetrahydropterin/6-carboxytetrahydropterin synthase
MDFGDLKKATNAVVDRLDHTFLNEVKPFDTIEPSAENIAHYLFHEIADQLADQSRLLYRVSVWESDTSKASFYRDTP